MVLLAMGCASPEVIRVVDGRPVPGRFVSAAAYDAYLRAVLAEGDGDGVSAAVAYREAIAEDPTSPELWARLAAVQCAHGTFDDAERSFTRSTELDAEYEPGWRHRARCLRARGLTDEALVAAMTAARLDPDRLEGQLLVAELLLQLGEKSEALRRCRGIVARWGNSIHAWRGLEAAARLAGDRGWLLAATEWLTAHDAAAPRQPLVDPDASRLDWEPAGSLRWAEGARAMPPERWAAVDAALLAGQLADARRAARASRIDPRQIAPRAIVLARLGLAREQAQLMLEADPADTDSRLALALTDDLAGRSDRMAELLALPDQAARPSAVSTQILVELLDRYVGDWAGSGREEPAPTAGQVPGRKTAADEPTQDLLHRLSQRAKAPPVGGPVPHGAVAH